jgi:hypothetical protein
MTQVADELKIAQNRFWYGYVLRENRLNNAIDQYQEFNDTRLLQEIVNLAFIAGGRWQSKVTELSPHIARFIEMMILLGYLERD